MSHARISPYYQSNDKIERFHRSVKARCIRPSNPLSMDDARHQILKFVGHYNEVRLYIAIGYVTPANKLDGCDTVIFHQRDRKLEATCVRRRIAHEAIL